MVDTAFSHFGLLNERQGTTIGSPVGGRIRAFRLMPFPEYRFNDMAKLAEVVRGVSDDGLKLEE